MQLYAQSRHYVYKIDGDKIYRIKNSVKKKIDSGDNIFYYSDTLFFSSKEAYITYQFPGNDHRQEPRSAPFQKCSIEDIITRRYNENTLSVSGKPKGEDYSYFHYLSACYEKAIDTHDAIPDELDISIHMAEEEGEACFSVCNRTDSILFFDIIDVDKTISVFSSSTYWAGLMIYPHSTLAISVSEAHCTEKRNIVFLASNKRFMTNQIGRDKAKAKSPSTNDMKITISKSIPTEVIQK